MASLPTQKSSGHRARKRFGQNFLVSESVIHKIVRALKPRPDEQLIEIGPGLGALTLPLVESGARVCAIELDRDLAERIEKLLQGRDNFQLVCEDALKVDFSSIYTEKKPLRIIGNLPYNISTPILFHLLKYADQILDMHFMLQREVVERMGAKPGSGSYGRLSVMIQYHCDVETVVQVPPGSFDPAPKVDSAVVKLCPRAPHLIAESVETLNKLVRTAFSSRRKTVRNSLKNELTDAQIESQNIDASLRPENLSVVDYVKLANCLYQTNNKHT